jgi:heme/copper-type cytochrome/quinol oxidase subunit 3
MMTFRKYRRQGRCVMGARFTNDRSVHIGYGSRSSTTPRRASRAVARLGFWSALLSATFSVGFLVAAFLIAPIPQWRGTQAYAEAFEPIDQLSVYPSLFLAVSFVVLMACVYSYARKEKRVFGLVGLALGVLYATMATINYQVQLVAVKQSLTSGEVGGTRMFLMANPHSVFFALMTSYVYMCLAMFFAAFVFEGGGLERWVRWVLLAMGPVALLQLAVQVFGVSSPILAMPMAIGWNVGTPAAFALLALLFKRAGNRR